MKKFLILAVTALLALTACEKKTVIGNGEIVCTPSYLTVKATETASFTFYCKSGRQFTEENPLRWTTINLDESSKGDVYIEYEGENTIKVTGRAVGKVIVAASVKEDNYSSLVLGGVEVNVLAR